MADDPTPTGTPPSGRFGLRLAFWYAGVFVASSLAIVLLTYTLLASSLGRARPPDRRLDAAGVLRAVRGGRAARARAGGGHRAAIRPPRAPVRARRPRRRGDALRQHAARVERLRRQQARRAQRSVGAGAVGLAHCAARSRVRRDSLDGTLLQVGKSTESREALLARFRTIVALVSVAIVLTGLAGGILVTRRMVAADSPADCARSAGSPAPATPKRACRSAPTATRSTS